MTGSTYSSKNEREDFRLSRFSGSRIRQFAFALILLCSGLNSDLVVSAADKSNDLDSPLVVINAASMQRLRDVVGGMFGSVDRADMTDLLDQWIVSTLKETKGLDRSRPFGMMLYLSPQLIGPPLGISYLPVTNLDEGARKHCATVSGRPFLLKASKIGMRFITQRISRSGRFIEAVTCFWSGPTGAIRPWTAIFPDPEKTDIAIVLAI